MGFHHRRSLLVAALAVGLVGAWPTASASANPRPHPVKCGATWTFMPTGPSLPPPSDYPGPATLTSCNQAPESGGGGTLSTLSMPADSGSSLSGTASVTWSNGGTTAFSYTETTLATSYRPCVKLGYPYTEAIRLTGTVTGNTVV